MAPARANANRLAFRHHGFQEGGSGAEDRKALRTGAEWLDLGDLTLDELPARIGELRQFRGLSLGREPPASIAQDGRGFDPTRCVL
jgi:hypothetical protein